MYGKGVKIKKENMSLKFTALEIGSGDAFLLEDGERKILFDSGGNKTKIVTLLKKKGITKIDLAICSHNDIDHANGFIGLLESVDYDIDEIWLPGTWATILKYVRDNGIFPEEIEWIVNTTKDLKEKNCNDVIFRDGEDSVSDLFDKESIESIEDFDDGLSYFSELIDSDLYDSMNRRYLHYEYYYRLRQNDEMRCECLSLLKLDRIIKICGLAYQKGSKIRWFEPVKGCPINIVDRGFVALNSHEMCRIQKFKNAQSFAKFFTLTIENECSLVFEYWEKDTPIIRFSADSDCTCQSKPYTNNIIITAPHHGSDANAIVYTTIQGKDVIWVRSDRKSSKRPCADFKNQLNRYCLACRNGNFKSEIQFEFQGNKWQHKSGNNCTC